MEPYLFFINMLNQIMMNINDKKYVYDDFLKRKINIYYSFFENNEKCKNIKEYSYIFYNLISSNHNFFISKPNYNYVSTNFKNIPYDYHIHSEYINVKNILLNKVIPFFQKNNDIYELLIRKIYKK